MKSRTGIIEIFPLGTELITPGKPNNVHLTALKGKFTQNLGYLLGYPNLYFILYIILYTLLLL